jgi:hypothetical protein
MNECVVLWFSWSVEEGGADFDGQGRDVIGDN